MAYLLCVRHPSWCFQVFCPLRDEQPLCKAAFKANSPIHAQVAGMGGRQSACPEDFLHASPVHVICAEMTSLLPS